MKLRSTGNTLFFNRPVQGMKKYYVQVYRFYLDLAQTGSQHGNNDSPMGPARRLVGKS